MSELTRRLDHRQVRAHEDVIIFLNHLIAGRNRDAADLIRGWRSFETTSVGRERLSRLQALGFIDDFASKVKLFSNSDLIKIKKSLLKEIGLK